MQCGLNDSKELMFVSKVQVCRMKNHLRNELLQAIQEINALQSEQTQAVIDGDPDFSRFDLLLHEAREKKEAAKYAWLTHVESHGCEEA